MQDNEIDIMIRILKRTMDDEHLTMQGMARRLGFSTGHLSMIFSGKRRPGIRFVRSAIAHFLEIRRMLTNRFERPLDSKKPLDSELSRGLKSSDED